MKNKGHMRCGSFPPKSLQVMGEPKPTVPSPALADNWWEREMQKAVWRFEEGEKP